MITKIFENFYEMFGRSGNAHAYFAPGRVNLIGEHTDYNGGNVFPCALNKGTYGVIRGRTDKIVRLFSENYPKSGVFEFDIDSLTTSKTGSWVDYVNGVVWALKEKGYILDHGFEILICGNLPNGAGLSSSASLEVLTGIMLRDEFDLEIDLKEIALVGQYAENKYNGCNCGIMDQFASAMGKENAAIFLDTNTLKYVWVPLELEDASIVITNSNVKHSLVESEYNQRRKECETALKDLQQVIDVEALCELDVDQFERYKLSIKDDTCRKRAKHAVYENQRTIEGVTALREGNITKFGKLMCESHESLRDDYEVSCKEIDILVELAWKLPGVIGSRITGGGFGGCTVSIVKNEAVENFKSVVGENYRLQTGLETEFYVVSPGEGARKIK